MADESVDPQLAGPSSAEESDDDIDDGGYQLRIAGTNNTCQAGHYSTLCEEKETGQND